MHKLQVEAAPQVAAKLWTPANIVTLIRICLVPVFVVVLLSPWPQWFHLPDLAEHSKSLIAAAIFVLISCTDWLDGYLARSRGEVTDFGKFMDPLADKILVMAALLALIELGSLPSWVALIIVAREFIVSGVRMVAASKGTVISASWYGKFKTVFQMIAIVLFTIKDSYMMGTLVEAFSDVMWVISWIVMAIALLLTVVSMLDYISKARELIGLGPSKRAKRKQKAESEQSENIEEAHVDVQVADIEHLAAQVISHASEQGITIGTAESLTGGMISTALTSISGSSAVVRGGITSYATGVKSDILDVPESVINEFGVVSTQVARHMAQGACKGLTCNVAVAVTGIAGPSGAEPGKPVGTVCLACASDTGITAQRKHFKGDRNQVRMQTTFEALHMIDSAVCGQQQSAS